MVVSARAVAAMGVSVVCLAVVVGPSLAQQPTDTAVRKTASQAAAAPKAPAPAIIGCVDMGAVFKGYDKVKFNSEEFKSAVMAKKGDLMKLMSEAEQEAQLLAKMTPGSVDYKKHEDRITQLKAQHEASREQYEREFTMREAEMLASLYKEIQSMVGRIAQYKGMTYIVRISNDPVVGSNPNSAMMAIERTIVYADPSNDITNDVVYNLNREYKAAGGKVPSPSSGTNANAASPTPNGGASPAAPAGAPGH